MVIIENIFNELDDLKKENLQCLNLLESIDKKTSIEKSDNVFCEMLDNFDKNKQSITELEKCVMQCDTINKISIIQTRTMKELINWVFVTESILENIKQDVF